MSALVSLCVLTLVQIANAQCEPPIPDFERAVDYQAWYESCVRGAYNEKQNAAPIYLTALSPSDGKPLVSAEALGFAGPLNSDSNLQPRPWDPQKHTEWEESYERSRKTLAQFATAAERPYALFPPVHMEGRPRLFCYLSPLHLGGLNICVKASIDNAWRAPGNEVNGDAIVAATRTTLLVARQAEREPFLLPYMASVKWRALCYDNLRYALHYGVLSRDQRAAALKVLREVDDRMPGFWTALCGNEAVAYDFYQALLAGRVGEGDLQGLGGPEKIPGRESVKHSAQRARAYIRHWQQELKQPWSPRLADRPDDPSADTLPNVAPALLPHPAAFTRGYTLTTRTEAMRRGVRLLCEIHAYRDRTGNWPATLDALGPDVVDPFGIDPHGDKPFGYKVIAGEPLLYSLATNARDDGGKHDDNWGDATNRITETDYVLWPVQP